MCSSDLYKEQLGTLKKVQSWDLLNFSHALTIIMMNWRRYRSLSGGLLIEKSIHDLVAKHSDPIQCNVHKDAPIAQVEKSSIHCSYDNLVVASPFLDFSFVLKLTAPPVWVIKNTSLIELTYFIVPFSFESRGPPVVVG